MNKQTLQFLAAFLSAAAAVAAAHAGNAEDSPAAPEGEPAKRGRGRPPADKTGTGTGDAGPTDEERFVSNQVLIKPLIDGNQGEEVKKVIAKYSKTGMKNVPAESQAAFEKDIAALAY